MNVSEVRTKYLNFFSRSPRNHAVIPSASLIPENDPTTLFIGSGMQPLVPYLMGKKHPKGTRLTNSQKCFRTEDIDEVGDNRHTTFFEMLGNWSLGDYFKEEQLAWFYEFLTKEIGLNPERIYVTVFAGNEKAGISRDDDSVKIWERLFKSSGVSSEVAHMGSEKEGGERGMKKGERVFYYDTSKNWWSRAGKPEDMPTGEIGGPDSEIFYDFQTAHDSSFGEHCHPNCDCGRFLEIGNSVFMEYIKKTDSTFGKLPQQNVDFGGGLERITAASNDNADVFSVDTLQVILDEIGERYGWNYDNTPADQRQAMRIVADHIRSATFIAADGVKPSNTEQGYLLRRLLRRAIFKAHTFAVGFSNLYPLVDSVIESYKDVYPTLAEKRAEIHSDFEIEEKQFVKTLERGKQEFEKIITKGTISGVQASTLFTTYGFPIELTLEEAQMRGVSVDMDEIQKEMEKHREVSRRGVEQKFKGGLADSSEKVIAYHTATHLLLSGLRKELGKDVHQAGSNITNERLRFDFTYPEKVSKEILEKVESFVNSVIKSGAHITTETMEKAKAQADPTIEGSFWEKYPDEVTVYTIKDTNNTIYSRELCGGPHIEDTSKIEGTFKITKEESVSAGVRRVRAVLL